MSSKDTVIEARDLTKVLSDKDSLKGISFKCRQGECIGILGPRGSGKTALLEILAGVSRPSSGSLFVFGLNMDEHVNHIKSRQGVVAPGFGLDEEFSVIDNLLVFGILYGISRRVCESRCHQLLRQFQLEDEASFGVNSLSPLQKNYLKLARALLVDPDVLIFNEPGEDLDRSDRETFFLEIEKARKMGITLVFASTSITHIEKFCDRVLLLNDGQILFSGHPNDVVGEVMGYEIVEFDCPDSDLDYYLARLKGRYEYQVSNNRVKVFLEIGQESRMALNYVSSKNLTIRPSHLGDAFLKLAGREIEENHY